MTLTIRGIGTARPGGTITQHDAASRAASLCCHTPQQVRFLHTVYRQSAVQQRGTVLKTNGHKPSSPQDTCMSEASTATADPDGMDRFYPLPMTSEDRGPTVGARMMRYHDAALALACDASRSALHAAGTSADDIAHLVVVSCTGFGAPGLDVRLIERLGLRADVSRTMVGFMGCHGAINGLRTAHALAHASPGEHVLLCCVELCSLHFQYGWDAQRVIANALFADGAAAAVGEANVNATSRASSWGLHATGSRLVPDSQDAMTWRIGDHGFEMTLSPRLPELIQAHLRPWLRDWLTKWNLAIDDIGSWAVHPGGPRVLDAVECALNLPAEATAVSRQVLSESGNMSSPTVLFIVEQLRRQGASLPCVALAFGPGVMIEAALFAR